MGYKIKIMHIIWIVFCLILISCSKSEMVEKNPLPSIRQKPMVLIVYESADFDSKGMMEHLTRAFEYVKIPYELVDLSIIRKRISLKPSVKVVYSTTSATEKIHEEEMKEFRQFVISGGILIQTTLTWDVRMHYLIGIKPTAQLKINTRAKGWKFLDRVLPGIGDDFEFKTEVMPTHKGFKRENFDRSVKILATALNDPSYIVLSSNQLGKGYAIYINSTIMNDKLYRGLLFSLALPRLEGIPYHVANVSTIFLDDFPAAMYNAMMFPINKEYGVDQAHFISRIWWPDMKALADTFDLAYTAMTCFNYNDIVTPPFEFEQWYNAKIRLNGKTVNASPWLARQVQKSRHELGFHGYNHISLWSRDWPLMKYILPSLFSVRKQWFRDELGDLPVTYVPPTNWIDSTGLDYLHKGLPSIRYMCSLYLGEVEEGGDREFDPDPYEPSLFDIPRITAGFIPTHELLFTLEGVYIFSGIWTHFIHPDDVFFENKGDKSIFKRRNFLKLWWKRTPGKGYGLYHVFRNFILRNQKIHPLIRFRPIKKAGPIIMNWRQSFIEYRVTGDSLRIRRYLSAKQKPDTTFYFVYISEKHWSELEEQLIRIAIQYGKTRIWDGYLVEFGTTNNQFLLPDFRKSDFQADDVLIKKAEKEYRTFIRICKGLEVGETQFNLRYWLKKFLSGKIGKNLENKIIRKAIEANRLDIAIRILKKRVLSKNTWNENDLNQLIELLYWNRKEVDIWRVLQARMEKYPTPETIQFKNIIEKKVEKPEWFDDKQWFKFELQIGDEPNLTLIRFLKSHDSEKYYFWLKPMFRDMVSHHQANDSLFLLMTQRMFWYEIPDSIIKWISGLPDRYAELLLPYAKQIAQLYAYNLKDYSRGFLWSLKDSTFNLKEQFEWLFIQKRYADIFQLYHQNKQKILKDDTLRIWLGMNLMDEGFVDEGLKILSANPIPEENGKIVKEKLSNYIAGAPEPFQKKILKTFPVFINKDVSDSLQYRFKWTERPQIFMDGIYHEDNFKNRMIGSEIGIRFGWESKLQKVIKLGYWDITTGTGITAQFNPLKHFTFGLFQKNERKSTQRSAEISVFQTSGSKFLWGYYLQYAYGNFTSLESHARPVESAPALDKKIIQIQQSLYSERFWKKYELSTSIFGSFSYYTDGNIEYEANISVYWLKPPKERSSVYIDFGIAYQDATKVIPSGIPYWTPDRLWTIGGGIAGVIRRKYLHFYLQADIKHDRESGIYGAISTNWSLPLAKAWKCTGEGYFSTSRLYRYNQVRIGISYAF